MVMNYTETEAKVREATNDESWGPTGSMLQVAEIYTSHVCEKKESSTYF
jgi:hypothetical protein